MVGALIGLPLGDALFAARACALRTPIGAVVLFAVAGTGARSLVTRDVEARIADLPSELDGVRIVQLSDSHVGPQRSRAFLSRVVRNVMALRADMIAFTSDLTDDRPENVAV